MICISFYQRFQCCIRERIKRQRDIAERECWSSFTNFMTSAARSRNDVQTADTTLVSILKSNKGNRQSRTLESITCNEPCIRVSFVLEAQDTSLRIYIAPWSREHLGRRSQGSRHSALHTKQWESCFIFFCFSSPRPLVLEPLKNACFFLFAGDVFFVEAKQCLFSRRRRKTNHSRYESFTRKVPPYICYFSRLSAGLPTTEVFQP